MCRRHRLLLFLTHRLPHLDRGVEVLFFLERLEVSMQYSQAFVNALREISQEDLARAERLYESTYSQANSIPFPGYRSRHRYLLNLCGVHPLIMAPQLPPWWQEILLLAPTEVQPVLSQLSAHDFYQGQLNKTLFAQLKETGRACTSTPGWARSPRLGKILSSFLPTAHPLYKQFELRGCKLQENIQLVVSAHPWDVLTMGTSRHYATCQDITGQGEGAYQNKLLPANLLDSGMLVAYIADEPFDRWCIRRMQTRTILRLLWSKQTRKWGVLIDRFYGDVGQMKAMHYTLALLLQQHGLALWCPPFYYQYQQGIYVPVATPNDPLLDVRGPQQRFGPYALPYLDQTRANPDFQWQRVYGRSPGMRRLVATVIELSLSRI
jgi:hypothetical protein